MGEFNLPDINWHLLTCESISSTHFSFKFLECIHDCLLNQMVDSPTRIRIGQRSNILDLVVSIICIYYLFYLFIYLLFIYYNYLYWYCIVNIGIVD